jgi:hypothetical protein
MSQVLASFLKVLPLSVKSQETEINKKLIHPKVLRATKFEMPSSPTLIIKDEFQPSKGDLRLKIFS